MVAGALYLDNIPSFGAGTADDGIATALAAWALALYKEAFQSSIEKSCGYN